MRLGLGILGLKQTRVSARARLRVKVARYPVFSRSTNLESKLIEFIVFVNF